MSTFQLGQAILHTKLGIVGIVENEAVLTKHIGNLLVSLIRVQVEEFHLEWMVESVTPVLPNIATS